MRRSYHDLQLLLNCMALSGCQFCDFLLEITQSYLTLHENLCIISVDAYRCNLHLPDGNSSCKGRRESTGMSTHSLDNSLDNSLDIETDAQSAILETEDLAQHGFEQDEITSLLRLREWYQNGGSDRIDVIRYLEFLKFLVSNDKLQS